MYSKCFICSAHVSSEYLLKYIIYKDICSADTICSAGQHKQGYLHIKECSSFEYLELYGMLKLPLCMANVLSPNGSVKKHSL